LPHSCTLLCKFVNVYTIRYLKQTVVGVEGAGLVPSVGGPLDASFGFLHKRSIPKSDQHRKDIIQQESLGTDML